MLRTAARGLVVGLVLAAVTATAAVAKPKVAILGLEVVGNLDPEQTRLAKDLTIGLRERARAGTGPYELAPNSEKELVDEKLMNNCGNEALACMSPIGINLGADYLMYGKIEKVDRGYQLTIKLLRVAAKMPMPAYSEVIPAADVKSDPKGVAKRAYAKLTAAEEATVTIRVPVVDRATVYIDNEAVGTTASGVLTIAVAEGSHKLAVVATEKGWKRHEENLAVRAGESRTVAIELARTSAPAAPPVVEDSDKAKLITPPGTTVAPGSSVASGELIRSTEGTASDSGGSRAGWRTMFALSAAVGLAGGAVWVYGWREVDAANKANCRDLSCNPDSLPAEVRQKNNDRGNRGERLSFIGLGVVSVGAIATVFTFYKGFLSSSERKPVAGTGVVGRSTRPRRELTVTPVVAPNGGGATLRFDW